MTSQCIHGFPDQQCAACRTCPHDVVASGCVRCRAVAAAPGRHGRTLSVVTPPSEEHAGFEIFYVPAVSGWQYRAPDSAPSRLSYRSAFLARKAVDELRATPAVKRSAKRTT
jgi:hypothetical protein